MFHWPGVRIVSNPTMEQNSEKGFQIFSERDGDDGKVCTEREDGKQSEIVTKH